MAQEVITTNFDEIATELEKLIVKGKVQSFVVYVDSDTDYVEIREEEVD